MIDCSGCNFDGWVKRTVDPERSVHIHDAVTTRRSRMNRVEDNHAVQIEVRSTISP